jgi:hypothetical protein
MTLFSFEIWFGTVCLTSIVSQRITTKSMHRFVSKLRDIAPDIAKNLEHAGSRFYPRMELMRYVWVREYRLIGDGELNQLGNRTRLSSVLSLVIVMLLVDAFLLRIGVL